jgi:hypothetical protein
MKVMNIQPIMVFIKNKRANWNNHVLQMSHSRIPFQTLHYQPNGQRSLGRPYTYWHETLTGHNGPEMWKADDNENI